MCYLCFIEARKKNLMTNSPSLLAKYSYYHNICYKSSYHYYLSERSDVNLSTVYSITAYSNYFSNIITRNYISQSALCYVHCISFLRYFALGNSNFLFTILVPRCGGYVCFSIFLPQLCQYTSILQVSIVMPIKQ